MIDYISMMQKYHGSRNDGFLTDAPKPIQLADDDYVRVRYDAKAMRWVANLCLDFTPKPNSFVKSRRKSSIKD